MVTKVIGVLDLQGGVQEHLAHLQALSIPTKTVKLAKDLKGLGGLIIPGGESTCLMRLMHVFNLIEPILQEYHAGLKIFGTCAGTIVLSSHGFIDIDIKKNAFGGQLDSFSSEAVIPEISSKPIPLTFIRAPQIVRAGSEVTVLLRINHYMAAVETSGILATIFHPELTPSLAFHRYFAQKCGFLVSDEEDFEWNRHTWMNH